MNKEINEQMIKSYLANQCSEEEKNIVENWYVQTAEQQADLLDTPDYFEIQEEILNNLRQQQGRTKVVFLNQKVFAIAAAVLIILTAGVYFYPKYNQNPQLKKQLVANPEIKAGGNKAYLTLADGKRIILSDNANGEVAAQAGIKVTKTKDGQLVYTSLNNNAKINSNLFNKIEAPIGGQYQLILPDGTKIWLNSATSLKYPVSFAGLKQRKVELDGEAYFEVAKMMDKPFIVITKKQTIEVLGTHFNVNCYADEPATKTSLIEGAVKIFTDKNTNPQLLKPGQQATLKDDNLKISAEDVQQAIAWRNGDFVFNGENLQSLMREIARWYGVEVVYKGDIPNNTGFISNISRKKKLAEILNAIELNQNVKFKIEGRRVIVMP